jgi:thiol-disulfide isomerase/thioredoxin
MQQYDRDLFDETATTLTLGGTKKKTSKNVLHVGKIFADWCGHCQSLQPEWARMKNDMKLAMGRSLKNVHIEFVEIGDTPKNKSKGLTVEGMMSKYNGKHLANSAEKLKSDGYPTLFKVLNGKLTYYPGARDASSMYKWYMEGVSGPKNMTNKAMKGGRRSRSTKPKGLIHQFTEILVAQPLISIKNRFLTKNNTRKNRR